MKKAIGLVKKVLISIVLLLIFLIAGGLTHFQISTKRISTTLKIDEIKKIENEVDNKTRIYILGTSHKERAQFNSDSILFALCRINPDVILVESDASFFNDEMELTFPILFKLGVAFKKMHIENEFQACLNYKIINRDVKFRPYDISNRNRLHRELGINSKPGPILNKIREKYSTNTLSKKHQRIWVSWQSKNKAYNFGWDNHTSPADLNSIDFINVCRVRQHYKYDSLNHLIQTDNDFKSDREFYHIHADFWHLRNRSMVQNILSNAAEFQNQTIVVLTGATHKYYLLDELENEVNHQIELLEYYKQ